jgi:predicted amidohydrolase YtcJ
MRQHFLHAVLCGAALGVSMSGCTQAAPPATIVVRHATIWTGDSAAPSATALAIRDDRIVWVGHDSAVQRYIGDRTQVIDAGGRFVMPGFIDTHVHPVSGGLELTQCDLNEVTDLAGMRAAVRACAERTPPGEWIRGGGYQQPIFANGRPSRALLDSLAGDHPALLSSSDGHTSWANSRALAIAGISTTTPDPDGGRIDRDARGEPSGTLRERAINLVSKHVPPNSDVALDEGLSKALERAAQFGITTLYESSAGEAYLRAYVRADSARRLTARVVVSMQTSPVSGPEQVVELAELRTQYSRGLVQPIAAKIFADGVLEAGTAAVLSPYLDGKKDLGILNMGPESMSALVHALDSAGFKVHIHAIGDRGVRVALDALESQHVRDNGAGPRHQIVHLQLIDPADMPRFAALGVVASFQALWHQRDGYIVDLTEPRLGPERSARLYAMQSLIRSGAHIAGGSDWSVTSLNPLHAIEVAVTRRALGDTTSAVWLPGEAVSVETMLRAYTSGGGYALDREQELGVLRAGALADLIMLSDDLLAMPIHRLHAARVLLTIMGGREVWRDPTIMP